MALTVLRLATTHAQKVGVHRLLSQVGGVGCVGSTLEAGEPVVLAAASLEGWARLERRLQRFSTPPCTIAVEESSHRLRASSGRGLAGRGALSCTLHPDLGAAVAGESVAASAAALEELAELAGALGGEVIERYTRTVGSVSHLAVSLPSREAAERFAGHPQIRRLEAAAQISLRAGAGQVGL